MNRKIKQVRLKAGLVISFFSLIFSAVFLHCETGGAEAAGAERLIIIDDDLAMLKHEVARDGTYMAPWLKITDPDGGLELIYVLREPGVRVLGVTCAMGCSSTRVCMESAKKILELAGHPEIPVLEGARSAADLGKPTEAARFIIDMVMGHPGQVEIIATAPLTNIATALMLEPCLTKNWKALHFATGEFMGALGEKSDAYPLRYFYHDLNINADPEAARYVLDRGGDFPIYPNEIMDDAWLTRADLRALKQADTPLARLVADELNPFFSVVSTVGRLVGFRGLNLHGVIPAAMAFDPSLAEPPRMLRVTMVPAKSGGFAFALTNDPAVPLRPVYTKLKDPQKVQAAMIERCR